MRAIVCYLVILFLFAPNVDALYMNEIHPAPSSGYEWVEVYNEGSHIIDVADYKIYDLTGRSLTLEQLIIGPNEYVIATASSMLNNGGDTIFLEDSQGVIIETITYGAINKGHSYERCTNQWEIVETATKKRKNLCFHTTPTTTQTPTPKLHNTIIRESQPTYSNISLPLSDQPIPTPDISDVKPAIILYAQKHQPAPYSPAPIMFDELKPKPTPLQKKNEAAHQGSLMLGSAASSLACVIMYVAYLFRKWRKNEYNELI